MSWRISSDFENNYSYVGLEFKTNTYEQSSRESIFQEKKSNVFLMINKRIKYKIFHEFM